MENNKQFTITYYSGKDKKHITRLGKWVEGCRYWTSKSGKAIFYLFLILRQIILEMRQYLGK